MWPRAALPAVPPSSQTRGLVRGQARAGGRLGGCGSPRRRAGDERDEEAGRRGGQSQSGQLLVSAPSTWLPSPSQLRAPGQHRLPTFQTLGRHLSSIKSCSQHRIEAAPRMETTGPVFPGGLCTCDEGEHLRRRSEATPRAQPWGSPGRRGGDGLPQGARGLTVSSVPGFPGTEVPVLDSRGWGQDPAPADTLSGWKIH